MTDIPIIFSEPMVRALLDGRKTMTRRLAWRTVKDPADDKLTIRGLPSSWQRVKTGDRLWVKEAWRVGAWSEDAEVAVDYRASPELKNTPWMPVPGDRFNELHRKISDELRRLGVEHDADGNYDWKPGESPLCWHPSIHMPRWASRLTLTVTETKVERLQDITEADAMAEGVYPPPAGTDDDGVHFSGGTFRDGFWALWNSLHGLGAWLANPEVVAISFAVERRNVDAV